MLQLDGLGRNESIDGIEPDASSSAFCKLYMQSEITDALAELHFGDRFCAVALTKTRHKVGASMECGM